MINQTYEPEFSVVLLSPATRRSFQALDDQLRLDVGDVSVAARKMGRSLRELRELLGPKFVSYVNSSGWLSYGTARRLIVASEQEGVQEVSNVPLFGYADPKTLSKVVEIGQ